MSIFFAAALLVANPVVVASPAPATAQANAARAQQALTKMGFSPAGIAILLHPTVRSDAKALGDQMRQTNAAIVAALQAKPFDAARFDKALRDAAAFRTQIESIKLAQVLDILRRLPAADQPLFARGLVTRPASANGAAPAPR